MLAYAPSPGIPELIDAIQNYYDKLDMHFDKSEIYVTAGGSEALQIALQCILDDGDEILIPEPFYPNYNTMTRTCGASIRPIPTCPEEGYRYADREKIESLINEHTRAIMVTNPGNPTGVVLSHAEMEMLVDVAQKHDLFLIGDEAYREFVYGGEKLQSFGEFADRAGDNIIVIDTVSKRFSACGARIGCLISKNRELMNHAMKYCQARLSVATLDQIASAALYTVGPEYFAAVRDEYKKRRDTLCRKLGEIPGVVFDVPGGAFYVMAALPVDDADKFQQWLLEEFSDNGETVMMAPGGSMYATPGKGKNEVRMAYVLESDKLERAMEILKKAIEPITPDKKEKIPMIRHIVMWKFREGTEEKANEFLTKLAALDGVIPQFKKCEVARNIGKDNYDAVLVSEFETMDDLNAYKVDPRHVAVSDICKSIRADRVAVDYEM